MSESRFVRFQLAQLQIIGDRLVGRVGSESPSEHMERVCADHGLTVAEYFKYGLAEPMDALAFERLLLAELMSPRCAKRGSLELQIRGALRDARSAREGWIIEVAKGAAPVVLEHVLRKSKLVEPSELGHEPSDDGEACTVQTVLHHGANDLRHLLVRPREALEYLLRNPRREHLVPSLLRAFIERTTASDAKPAKRIASEKRALGPEKARQVSDQELRGFMKDWMEKQSNPTQNDAALAAQTAFPGRVTRDRTRLCFQKLCGGQLKRGPKGPRKHLKSKPK